MNPVQPVNAEIFTPARAGALVSELHDNIAQSLSAANLILQTLIEQSSYPEHATRTMLIRAHTTTRTANAELRRVIDELRSAQNSTAAPTRFALQMPRTVLAPISPGSQKLVAIDRLRRLGLIAALKKYFEHASNDRSALIFTPKNYTAQLLSVEVELFRIAQEAVSNAIRHGKAKTINITLSESNNQITLMVDDDGCGAALEHLHTGVGLRSMQDRAARLGGVLTLERSASGGVLVHAAIPHQPA
jgi:signal transduction histidine kinase